MKADLIEPADRAPLLKHRDPEIARLRSELFRQRTIAALPRQVVGDYLDRRSGSREIPARGQKVFARECKTCHKIGEVRRGDRPGPDGLALA